MADEVTDLANNEQFVTCIRSVNDNLEPNEDFIGLYHFKSIQAAVLVQLMHLHALDDPDLVSFF